MNVQRLLLFCFLSAALWDENVGIKIFQRYSGDDMKHTKDFVSNASVRFFCRRECKGSDVLIRTDQNKSVSGRYSIEYKKTPKGGDVTGFISSLETSDSGRYRIGVGRSLVPDEFWDFEIRVTGAEDPHNRINIHAEEEGGTVSVICWLYSSSSTKFFCRNDCSNGQILLRTTRDEDQSSRYSIRSHQDSNTKLFTVETKISQLKLSDTGLYSCGLGESLNSTSFTKFNILVTVASPPTQSSGSPPFSPPPETFNLFSGFFPKLNFPPLEVTFGASNLFFHFTLCISLPIAACGWRFGADRRDVGRPHSASLQTEEEESENQEHGVCRL